MAMATVQVATAKSPAKPSRRHTKVSATATTVCRTTFAFLCLSADLLGERTSTQRKTLHAVGRNLCISAKFT